jgi:hypothetical protein
MNIFVRPVDSTRTRIRVNARYVFTMTPPEKWDDKATRRWVFDTGSSATQTAPENIPGISTRRKCGPSYTAEKAILTAVRRR